jgi:protein gp37
MMNPQWARDLRDECAATGVPFFMKQIVQNGKKVPFDEWPSDLKVREYPC